MAHALFELSEKGLDEAIASLDGMQEVIENDDAKWAIARYLSSEAKNRFDTKTAPDGAGWKQSVFNPDTLRKSGNLQRSISEEVVGDSIYVGTRGSAVAAYARAQQDGVTIKPVNAKALAFQAGNKLAFAQSVTLPARPYIGFADRDKQVIVDMLADAISAGAAQ